MVGIGTATMQMIRNASESIGLLIRGRGRGRVGVEASRHFAARGCREEDGESLSGGCLAPDCDFGGESSAADADAVFIEATNGDAGGGNFLRRGRLHALRRGMDWICRDRRAWLPEWREGWEELTRAR